MSLLEGLTRCNGRGGGFVFEGGRHVNLRFG